ncbi:MAG TPA: hypothetical protein VHE54_09830, partial [Puia sp.]|nr:hypothetical protein [Puia sp.]
MLNRFYYLQHDLPGHEPVTPGGITIAHVLDGHAGAATAALTHQYSADGNYPFCLMLRDVPDAAAALKQSLLFFFHPQYEMTAKGRPVFIFGQAAAGTRTQIERLLETQGLEAEVIFARSDAGDPVITLDANDPEAADAYYRYCLTGYRPEDIFLLSGGGLAAWQRQLGRVDARLAESHPDFYRLAQERLSAAQLAAERGREIGRLNEELAITNQLLDLSNRHDEVDYI